MSEVSVGITTKLVTAKRINGQRLKNDVTLHVITGTQFPNEPYTPFQHHVQRGWPWSPKGEGELKLTSAMADRLGSFVLQYHLEGYEGDGVYYATFLSFLMGLTTEIDRHVDIGWNSVQVKPSETEHLAPYFIADETGMSMHGLMGYQMPGAGFGIMGTNQSLAVIKFEPLMEALGSERLYTADYEVV